MIDFHNHILPGVDDGSDSLEMSLSMLRKAEKQGITEIVNTVHIQHPKMYDKKVDHDYLLGEVEKLQKSLDEEKINIKIHLSSEVFYLPNLIEVSKNPLNTIGNGKYMLIEFIPGIFPRGYEEEFYKLQSVEITPIVAHPERYKFIQKDLEILKEWIKQGYVIQLDAGSIRGHFGDKIKEIAIKMVEKGYVHLIGSDAHDNKGRNFCLKKTYDFLGENWNADLVNTLKNNAINLLEGNQLEQIKKNRKNDKGHNRYQEKSFIDKFKNFFKVK